MNIGLKTFTFALTHFSVAFTVAWLLTGSLLVGGLIALVEPAINTVAYVIHEKIWQNKQHTNLKAPLERTEVDLVRLA